MANYLVTGGGGFIGSNLVHHLVEHGEAVRVLDNFLTGRRPNLEGVENKIELMEGDLRDPDACARAAEDMDFVLHHGALPSVPRSIDRPAESADINVMGTVQLLHACVRARVKRFVYAGSSSAYGDYDLPLKSEDLLPRPLSPYAAAKLAGEQFCAAFHRSFDLPTVCLRYFNIFGPRQDPNSPYSAVIPKFISCMLAGRRPPIQGDGTQTRDFTFVANAVHANILAANSGEAATGRVFNVACGGNFSLLDLVAGINEILGTSIEPEFQPSRTGDVRHSRADISLAREFLGFEPKVDFRDGLARTIAWYRENAG